MNPKPERTRDSYSGSLLYAGIELHELQVIGADQFAYAYLLPISPSERWIRWISDGRVVN